MADLTIRSVFARLGFKVDDEKLDEFDRKIDKAKADLTETVSVGDRAREALRRLGAAGKAAGDQLAAGARAGGSAIKAFGAVDVDLGKTIGGFNKAKEVIGFAREVGAAIADAGEHVGKMEGWLASSGLGIEKAAEATGGLVSNFDLAGGAAAAMEAQLVSSDEAFAQYAGDVTRLARRAGDNTKTAIGRMSQALRGGNTELLQQYGVVVNSDRAIKDYAESVGKLTEDLTDSEKAHAVAQAAMEAMHAEADGLGSTLDSNSARIERMQTRVENLGTAFKQGLVTAVGETIGVLERLEQRYDEVGAAGGRFLKNAFKFEDEDGNDAEVRERMRQEADYSGLVDFIGQDRIDKLKAGAGQLRDKANSAAVANEERRKADERELRALKRMESERERAEDEAAYEALKYGPKPPPAKKKIGGKGPELPYALRSLVDLDRNVGEDTTDMILDVLKGGDSRVGSEITYKLKQKKDKTTQQLYDQLHRARSDDKREEIGKRLEGHLLTMLKAGEATSSGMGNGEAAQGLGTRIINIDARITATTQVVAPEGLVGAGPTEARRVAQQLGDDINAQMEPYLQQQLDTITKVVEG